MTDPRTPTTGEMITTFTFLLFGLLLGLAAAAEPMPAKAAAMGACAVLSLLGAGRFKIQRAVALWRKGRR